MSVLVRLGERARPTVERLLADADDDVRIFAANVLGDIRQPAAFEALQAVLSDPNENVRYAASEALGKIGDPRGVLPLLQIMRVDEWVRFAAIESLGRLGDPAAAPHLLPLLNDPWLRLPAIEALGRLGDAAVGWKLLPHVTDGNTMVSHVTIAALGRIDARCGSQLLAALDASMVQALIGGALDDTDPSVRRSAVAAIGWAGSGDMLPRLLGRLDDPAEEVQEAARRALVRLGWRELPALLAAFRPADADHRLEIAAALGEIRDPAAADALIAALADMAGPVRAAAAAGLGQVGGRRGAEALLPCLSDASPDVRRAAAEALGRLRHVEASSRLFDLLEDPVAEVRMAAATAVARTNVWGLAARLAPLVRGARAEVREAAIHALGLLAQEGSERTAEAYLIEALSHADPVVRRLAAAAMGPRPKPAALAGTSSRGGTGPLSPPTPRPGGSVAESVTPPGGVPVGATGAGQVEPGHARALLNALLDEDWQVRKLAVEALGQWGDRRTATGLLGALADGNPWVRYAAVRALGDLGERTAVEPLLRALAQDEDAVKLAAAGALGRLGDARAVPALAALTRHEDVDFRVAAAEALGQLRRREPGAAAEVEAALRALVLDPQPSVRRAAVQGLACADEGQR
jgi:HEAT repeat protein